jgi:hypothetical protein
MRKAFLFALALTTIASSSVCTSSSAGAADDKMMMSKIDCSQAATMMTGAANMGGAPTMTGDVDKDFTTIAMAREKGTNMLMKVEAQCGKDPKMKAMAQKFADDSDARMALFRNEGMSQ